MSMEVPPLPGQRAFEALAAHQCCLHSIFRCIALQPELSITAAATVPSEAFSLNTLISEMKLWLVYCFFLSRIDCSKSKVQWSLMAQMPGSHSCAALGNTLANSIMCWQYYCPKGWIFEAPCMAHVGLFPCSWAVFYKSRGHCADWHSEFD